MRKHLLTLIVGFTALFGERIFAQSYRPVVGQPHPEILLPRIDTREAVALSQFRGKKVLLIHFASW